MAVAIALLAEVLVAEPAPIGPNASVCAQVLEDVPFFVKNFATQLACEHLVLTTCLIDCFSQKSLCIESLSFGSVLM